MSNYNFEGAKRPDLLHHVESLGLVVHPDLAQKQASYTMTLNRIYADGNEVVVDFSVVGNNANDMFSFNPSLFVMPDNKQLPLKGGNSHPEDGAERAFFFFDAENMGDAPEHLDLHLIIDVSRTESKAIRQAQSRATAYIVLGTDHISIPSSRRRTSRHKPNIGTFDFHVRCPFTPARRALINHTIESNGTKVTLEKASVSPLETVVHWRIHRLPGLMGVWMPENSRLAGDTRPEPIGQGRDSGSRRGGTSYFRLNLYDKQDDWTFTIEDIRCMSPFRRRKVEGTWQFNFSVPPAAPDQEILNG